MKTCSKCGVPKDDAEFRKWHRQCRGCERVNVRQHYQDNKEKRKKYSKEYYHAHPERCRKRAEEWRAANPERVRETDRQHAKRNRKRENETARRNSKKRYASDPSFRVERLLRTRIWRALKSGGAKKSAKTYDLLGCPLVWFKVHLESLFTPGMTWENQGSVWHIDHIRPCSSFDLTDPEQQRVCFHWTNQQPLLAFENLSKGSKYDPQTA